MTDDRPADGAARGYSAGGLPAVRRVLRDVHQQYRSSDDGNDKATDSERDTETHKGCGWVEDTAPCNRESDVVIGISDATVDTPTTTVRVCERHLVRAQDIDYLTIEWTTQRND